MKGIDNMANRPVIPQAEGALNRFRMEIAKELGIPDGLTESRTGYNNLNSKIHKGGNIGGEMVRRMIQYVEEEMAEESRS